MTTMDSDSESQDSDEGRRFRFETTRKDSNPDLQSHRHKPSLFRPRRSRSRDRSRRDRKDEQHPQQQQQQLRPRSHERRKDSRSSRSDDRRCSKDRKTQKENESKRKEEAPRHKDNRDLKVSSHKETLRRDSRPRDFRDSKSRDDKRRRSREKSYEKIKTHRDKRDKQQYQQYSIKEKDEKSSTKLIKNNINNPINEENNEKSPIADAQECKDLNISDFDIVSDTEGENSNSSSSQCLDTRKQAADNTREFQVKNHKNGDASPGPSNCNPDTLSDLLLGNTSMPSSCSNDIQSQNIKYCTDVNSIKKNETNSEDNNHDDNDDDCSYGPSLPPCVNKNKIKIKEVIQRRIIGPSLPEDFRKLIAQDNDHEDEEADAFGPALPPHLQRIKSEDEEEEEEEETIGPLLPRNIETDEMEIGEVEEEDDDVMGPLPADHPALRSDRIQQQLEYRARLIKEELAQIDSIEEKKREEWMTELPSAQAANLGLGPRKFRSREGPDMSDRARSGWTETPADRARKQRELQMGKRPVETDVEIEAPVEKSSKRHEKSLLEVHQKKLHKKKKKEEKEAREAGKKIRRPFDRDIDMQVNRVDQTRKKNILMKANALDDRFARGKI